MSRWLPLVALVVLVFASAGSSRPPAGPVVTHGVVVGDVSAGSAVLWARADREATLQVRLSGGAHRAIEPVSAVVDSLAREYDAALARVAALARTGRTTLA